MLQKVKPAVQLKDMGLFRQQCYKIGRASCRERVYVLV